MAAAPKGEPGRSLRKKRKLRKREERRARKKKQRRNGGAHPVDDPTSPPYR